MLILQMGNNLTKTEIHQSMATSPTHQQHLHLKEKNSTVCTFSNFMYLNRNFHLLEI